MSRLRRINLVRAFGVVVLGMCLGYVTASREATIVRPSNTSEANTVDGALSRPLGDVRVDSVDPDSIQALLAANVSTDFVIGRATGDLDPPVGPIRLRNVSMHQLLDVLHRLRPQFNAFTENGLLRIAYTQTGSPETVSTAYSIEDLLRSTKFWLSVTDVAAANPSAPQEILAQNTLSRLVQDMVVSEFWRDNGGSVGQISFYGDTMVVTQTPKAQTQIADLLEVLRRIVDAEKAKAAQGSATRR